MIEVVVGIIQQHEKMLVAKRPEGKPYSGYWEFPGGKIEPHETAYEALCRELKEELSIDVSAAQAWLTHQHTYPDKTVILHLWRVSAFQGTPTGVESQELQWVTLPELQNLRVLEGNLPIIEKLNELLSAV